jgi:peptide/nickel transport system permease protein
VPELSHSASGVGPLTATELPQLGETQAEVQAYRPDIRPPRRRRRRLQIGLWLSLIWITVITLAAVLAPVLPLKDPVNDLDFSHIDASWFTAGHPFGTDDLGRDVLSRVIWGARASLMISVGAVLLGVLIGGLLGLIAGYRRGRTDTVLSAGFNILLAFPQLVLALTLVAVLSPNTDKHPATFASRVVVIIIAVGIVSIPILARITRANTLAWATRDFVTASRAQGAKTGRVMFREVLPNVLPAMLSIALLGVAVVIVLEGGLAIFGLSIPDPNPSWGNMIAAQIDTIDKAPNIWQAPAAFIFFTVLALNYLGDYVRSKFDVREAAI